MEGFGVELVLPLQCIQSTAAVSSQSSNHAVHVIVPVLTNAIYHVVVLLMSLNYIL